MTTKTPFEQMMAQAQEMMKSFPAMEGFSPQGVDKLWPTMPKEVMETIFGDQINPAGLDAKTRLMLTLAGLTLQDAQNEIALRQTVRHLIELDTTEQQVFEAISMMSVFAGLPAATRAMEIARATLDEGSEA